MRKHLLFYTFDYVKCITNSLKEKYSILDFERKYLHVIPISFGSEIGARLDLVV